MNPDDSSNVYLKAAYFASIAGLSIVLGFSATVNKHKGKSVSPTDVAVYEQGVALARKALIRATLYSVAGFGVIGLVGYCSHRVYEKLATREDNTKN